MLMALLLDAANIVGGLMLALPLLGRFPAIDRLAARLAGWRWPAGVVALVASGFFLIVHLISGPHLFHFEVVGIAVGVLLVWERLTGRRPVVSTSVSGESSGPGSSTDAADGLGGAAPASGGVAGPPPGELVGPALLVAVFGIIAIVVGLQGLFTPN